jgi:hypothetical protein
MSGMTHHERMLATLRGQPTDQIPWAPRMDLWAIAQRTRGTLLKEFRGLDIVQIAAAQDVACRAIGGDFTIPGGHDITLLGLGLDNHPDYPFRLEVRDLPVEVTDDGENLITRFETPAGEVVIHQYRDASMLRNGISLPFVKDHAINSPADFEPVAHIFDHLAVVPTPQAYADFRTRVGERGIAVAHGPRAASPMHLILHDLVAAQQFFYMYADDREALRHLAARIEPVFQAILYALTLCDAEVVFWGGNYDQDVTWPTFFEAEIAPWLGKASQRLHAASKLVLTHADGENRALLPLYPACGFDVAESVCPQPMTQSTLADIRAGMGCGTTVWGGIPSVTLLRDSMTDQAFEAYLDAMFGALGAGDHLILGVSDNVPPDADLARLEQIRRRIRDFGPVQPTT